MDRLLESGSLRLIQSGDTRLIEPGGELGGGPGPIPGVAIRVALGLYDADSALALWDVAEWDDALAEWTDTAPLVEISCDVLSYSVTIGRDQPLDRFRAGTATVEVDDPDGLWSPWKTAATPDAFTGVRPGIDLYIWAEAGGNVYPRFRGVVDAISDEWPERTDAPHRVTFHAVDAFADLAAFNGFEQPPVGAGETTGARIGRILDNAGFSGARDLDTGTITVQATTLAKSALDEAGLTTDTERGALFVDRAGTLTFRDRNGILGDPRYINVQVVIGDDGTADDVCYSDIELVSDAAKIRNQVAVSRAGGSVANAQDLTSIALYGIRTYRRLDLLHTSDADSAMIANEYVTTFAYADNRVESVKVSLVANQHGVTWLLGLDVLHLIEVRRRAEGFQLVAPLQIQAITERVTPDAWDLEFQTFAAVADNIFRVATWTDEVSIPEIGDEWDVGLWGY